MPATDKPKINLNLDSLDNEGRPEPFAFVVDGRRFVTLDPTEADWRDVADLDVDDVRGMLSIFLGPELGEFSKLRVPQFKLVRLVESINVHYGLTSPGEALGS